MLHRSLPQAPQVSIVVPVRNEEAHIMACIRNLLAQDYPPNLVEVLIVDGNSTDATCELVQRAINDHPDRRIQLLHNPDKIVPTALNIGIRNANGEVVVRMDGHTVPEHDYVSACVRALQESGAANAGGRIEPHGATIFGDAVALAQSHPIGSGDAKFHYSDTPQFVDTVYLGAFRREIFSRAGLFDESMVRNQDYEMNVRIRNVDGKIYLDPSIRSRYTPRGSWSGLAKQYFEYGWWRVETWRRHPGSLRWRQLVPAAFVLITCLLAAIAPVASAARVLLGIQWFLYLAALGVATWQARDELRKNPILFFYFPVAVATMHLAWGLGFSLNLLTNGRFPHRADPPHVPSFEAHPSQVSV